MRVVPHRNHLSALQNFDKAVRHCAESFLCCSFSDPEWSLARLSTKMGGLGLKSTEQHSPAAFLSSQLACRDLCRKLDPYYSINQAQSQINIDLALLEYNEKVKQVAQLLTIPDTPPKQLFPV